MQWLSLKQTKPADRYRGIPIKADFLLHREIERLVGECCAGRLSVLDLGAGAGALSQRLADLGHDVLSVDMDKESFAASTEFCAVNFNDQQEVARFIDAHRAAFDLTLCVEVIEHVENPWELMRNIVALTKPGGTIVVSTPNVTSWYSRMKFLIWGRFHQFEDGDRHYGHINPIAADELRYIAGRLGLRVERLRSAGWLPRLWISRHPIETAFRLFGFLLSFLMRGLRDGWCIVGVFKTPEQTPRAAAEGTE